MFKVFLFFILLSFPWMLEGQIIQGFKNDFNLGNTEGWKEGGASPNQPVVILNGGPNGLSDPFLRNESSGQGGPGGKCVMFNQQTGWTGNYLQAGVNQISMHIKNPGTSSLYLRVAFNGMGGVVCSKQSIEVHPDTSWKWITFSLDTFQLLGLTKNGNITATLESVNEFRILSSVEPSFTGDQEMLTMDIDNIEADHDMLMWNRTGMQTFSFNQRFEIYPNPTVGILIIKALDEGFGIHKIQVINLEAVVLQCDYPSDQLRTEIELKGLVPGLYRLIINDKFIFSFTYIN